MTCDTVAQAVQILKDGVIREFREAVEPGKMVVALTIAKGLEIPEWAAQATINQLELEGLLHRNGTKVLMERVTYRLTSAGVERAQIIDGSIEDHFADHFPATDACDFNNDITPDVLDGDE